MYSLCLDEPYVHEEIPAEPYVHEEIPAEPYIHEEIEAEPYVHSVYTICAENEVLNARNECVPLIQIQQPEVPVDLSALFGYNEQ